MDLKYKVTVHYQRNIIKMKYFIKKTSDILVIASKATFCYVICIIQVTSKTIQLKILLMLVYIPTMLHFQQPNYHQRNH